MILQKKQIRLTNEQRLDVKALIMQKWKASAIAKRLGVTPQAVRHIKKQPPVSFAARTVAKIKRNNNNRISEIESELLGILEFLRRQRKVVSGAWMQQKALAIAASKGITHFKASNNWVSNFKRRLGLTTKALHGEGGSHNSRADQSQLESIKEEI
jgi:hypothetical protein